jgi:hypothetical protein
MHDAALRDREHQMGGGATTRISAKHILLGFFGPVCPVGQLGLANDLSTISGARAKSIQLVDTEAAQTALIW